MPVCFTFSFLLTVMSFASMLHSFLHSFGMIFFFFLHPCCFIISRVNCCAGRPAPRAARRPSAARSPPPQPGTCTLLES